MITNKLELTRSEVNTLIAGMQITAVRYDALKYPTEAAKYRELEDKLRRTCYMGEDIATVRITADFEQQNDNVHPIFQPLLNNFFNSK